LFVEREWHPNRDESTDGRTIELYTAYEMEAIDATLLKTNVSTQTTCPSFQPQ